MRYRNSLLLLLLTFVLSCNWTKDKVVPRTSTHVTSDHLVEAEELVQLAGKENIVIVDFRKPEEYAGGHIEGALNIWRTDIEDTSYPYKGMLAQKETVEILFSRLGIKNENDLVVYDDRGSADAARLWWLLKYYNFNSVQLLNGGMGAWKKAKGAMSNETKSQEQSEFTLTSDSPSPLLIGKDELKTMISSNERSMVILDTRTADEHSGKRKKEGAAKAGKIPKSIHIDWTEAIDYEGTKKFKTIPELEKIYSDIGAHKEGPIIVYCHTGVRSAHTTFVLTTILGYENVRNYDGSWTEWSYFDDLPFKKDSITTINK